MRDAVLTGTMTRLPPPVVTVFPNGFVMLLLFNYTYGPYLCFFNDKILRFRFMFLVRFTRFLSRLIKVDVCRHINYRVSNFVWDEGPYFVSARYSVFIYNIFLGYLFQTRLQRRRRFLGDHLTDRRRRRAISTSASAEHQERARLRYARGILISRRHFIVSFFTRTRLLFRTLFLVSQVIRLAVNVYRFFAISRRFRAFNRSEFTPIRLN